MFTRRQYFNDHPQSRLNCKSLPDRLLFVFVTFTKNFIINQLKQILLDTKSIYILKPTHTYKQNIKLKFTDQIFKIASVLRNKKNQLLFPLCLLN